MHTRVRGAAALLLGLILCLGLGMHSPARALGGGGSEPDTAAETVRKVKMLPLDEKNLRSYGWVRISADSLSLGANHLDPDNFYTVFFVNDKDRQQVSEEPTLRTSGSGEAKFTMRLTEPLGAKWGKIVIYQHVDGREERDGEMKPVMEAKLR